MVSIVQGGVYSESAAILRHGTIFLSKLTSSQNRTKKPNIKPQYGLRIYCVRPLNNPNTILKQNLNLIRQMSSDSSEQNMIKHIPILRRRLERGTAKDHGHVSSIHLSRDPQQVIARREQNPFFREICYSMCGVVVL